MVSSCCGAERLATLATHYVYAGGTVELGNLNRANLYEGDAAFMIDKEREAIANSELQELLKSMSAQQKAQQVYVCTFLVPHLPECNSDEDPSHANFNLPADDLMSDSRGETSVFASVRSAGCVLGAETFCSIGGSAASVGGAASSVGGATPQMGAPQMGPPVRKGKGQTAKCRSIYGFSSAAIAQLIRQESFISGLLVDVWDKAKVDEWLNKLFQEEQMPSKKQR